MTGPTHIITETRKEYVKRKRKEEEENRRIVGGFLLGAFLIIFIVYSVYTKNYANLIMLALSIFFGVWAYNRWFRKKKRRRRSRR